MKYGIIFLLLGLTLMLQAILLGGLWWVLVWPGVSFVLVAVAYLSIGPNVFGKRSDGTMAWPAIVVFLPYLLLTWGTWYIARAVSRERCYDEVMPGLFVGRRPLPGELPREVTLVVDLTAEFPERFASRQGLHYVAAPMLDAGIADENAFEILVRQIARWSGPVYIHCAQGHGRTGLVAAAVLIAKGQCTSPEAAIASLRSVRPRLSLSKMQLECLNRFINKEATKPQ